MLQQHEEEKLLKKLEEVKEVTRQQEKESFFVEIGSVIFDTETKEILQVKCFKRANSLLKQLFQIIGVQATQTSWQVKKTDGSLASVSPGNFNFRVTAGDLDTSYGIIVGNGTNPVTLSDFRIQNQLTSNIIHRPTVVGLENPSSTCWRALIYRSFVNNTGSQLNVSEVALYSSPAVGSSYCLDRTLYSLEVPTGQSFLVAYRISIFLT